MALTNLKHVLEAAGTKPQHIVKANVYLTDMKNFSAMNEAWFEFFKKEAGDYVPVSVILRLRRNVRRNG